MSEKTPREVAIDTHQAAEDAYLAALRQRTPNDELAPLAAAAASAADQWQLAAYPEFFERRDVLGGADRTVIELEIDAERAELLHGLWVDIGDAHRRQPTK